MAPRFDSSTPETNPSTTHPLVKVEDLSAGTLPTGIDIHVEGPTIVGFRRITMKAGGGTGEHCHDGPLVGVVARGELTHYAPTYPGGVHRYEQGDAVVEGAGYLHEGVNEGTEDLVLLVAYIAPFDANPGEVDSA